MSTSAAPTDTQTMPLSSAERSAIWRTRSGLYTLREVVSSVVEVLKNDGGTPVARTKRQRVSIRRRARRIVQPHWDRQLRSQQSWPEVTDVDCLTRAFSSLERNHKIIARMNVGCCRNCGIAELNGDLRDEDTAGFVFFHEQSTEGMLETITSDEQTELYLYFGSFTRSDAKNRAVGKRAVGSLRAVCGVVWRGAPGDTAELDSVAE